MDYYLRQIHPRIKNPLNIDLKLSQIIVGRSTNAELKNYFQVSRQHARFKKEKDQWFVEDLKSLNGVFVNGNRIEEKPVPLEIGDHIGLGIPAAGTDLDGYVCSLSVREKKKEIIFVDLCDESPIIKTEPPDDYPSKSNFGNSSNHHVNDFSSYSAVASTSQNTLIPKKEENITQNNDLTSYESISSKPASSTLKHQNTTINQFFNKKSATGSESSSSLKPIETKTEIDCTLYPSNPINKLTTLSGSSSEIKNSPVNLPRTPSLDESGECNNSNKASSGFGNRSVRENSFSHANVTRRLSTKSNDVSTVTVSNRNTSLLEKPDDKRGCNKYGLPLSEKITVKECSVRLVKCDSKHFKLPSDVKSSMINGVASAKEQSWNKIKRRKTIKRRISSSDASSSSDTEEKSNISKPQVKLKKTKEFSTFNERSQANVSFSTKLSSEQNTPITDNKTEGRTNKNLSSNDQSLANSSVSDIPVSENKNVKPSELFPASTSFSERAHGDNEQNILNEDLTNIIIKKETDDDEVVFLNTTGYSQHDEDGVIVISDDDDDYMDFSSSQVFIKQEPLEDERDLIIDEGMFDTVTANECVPDILNPDETFSESVENIRRFVESTFTNKDENPSSRLQDGEDPGIDTYFPMSQLLNNDEDSEKSDNDSEPQKNIPSRFKGSTRNKKIISESESSNDSDSSVDNNQGIIITPSVRKNVKKNQNKEKYKEDIQKQVEEVKSKGPKSVGRALLIEPQKLNRRPTRLCGRGEWFEDKATEQVPVPETNASLKVVKAPKNNKSKDPPKTKTSHRKKQENLTTRQSLLNKLQSPKKHKANVVTPQSSKKKQLQPSTKSSGKPILKPQPQKEPPNAKKNNPPISRRPNEYASRSAFLVSDMQPSMPKRKPINENMKVDNKESMKNPTVGKKNFPFRSRPDKVPSNIRYSIPSTSQSTMMKKTYNIGFGSLHQNKVVPTGIVTPLSAPSTSKASSDTNFLPSGYSNYRDPRLQRRLNSSDNPSAINQNYGAQNQMNNVNNITSKRNANYNNNNIPQRSRSNSTISHPSITNGTGQLPQHNVPFTATPGNYQSHRNIMNQRDNYNSNLSAVSFDGMTKKVVELNVKWLEEQQKLADPPPDVVTTASNLPLFFNSVDHYISSFFPMLMLEVWDNMYQESKTIFENKKRVAKKFYFTVLSSESKFGMTVYHCESVVNRSSFEPSEGNILLMDVRETNNRVSILFGYVFRHKIENFTNESLSEEWKSEKLGKTWLDGAKLWRFSVYLKNRQSPPMFKKLMKGNGICSIRNRLRLADALKNFASSPLNQLIIRPNQDDFYLKYPDVSPGRDYNYSQMMAIEGIGNEMLKQDPKPKIVLLQGPPGTGKTHTIIGLVEKLTSNPKFRVLVVAPSNAAIDEIGCRLLYLSRNNSRNQARIKFVRVGLSDQMHSKLRPHSLDEKASVLFKDYNAKTIKSKKEEHEKLRKQIDELKKQKQDYSTEKKIKILSEQLKKAEEQLATKSDDYRVFRSYKSQVLRESNVILSTLGSCGQAILSSCFNPNTRESFSCCIMDEASQCTETEALLPLIFGINKLIMVGDHQQLPATVSSKVAVAYGYERSMFERFYLFFQKYSSFNPIYMLGTQFRMHSEISAFPSKHFYDNLLSTDPHNDIRDENFLLHPYIVYDIMESQESDSSNSKTNCTEAHAIVDICYQILNMDSHSSIGIITPYQAQRALYFKALKQNPMYKHVEVNTVDGFQGREKDIIIVSCVRANSGMGGIGFLSCPKRLNVAITRARKCLIICVHSKTLVQNADWRALIEDARTRCLCTSVNSYRDMQLIFRTTMVKYPKSKRRL